jgi:hypothetical protein
VGHVLLRRPAGGMAYQVHVVEWALKTLPANDTNHAHSRSADFRSTHTSGFLRPTPAPSKRSIAAIEEVVAGQVLKAAGQAFEPDRPHKSLDCSVTRPRTKTLVADLKSARASDMASKPLCHTSLRFRSDDKSVDHPASWTAWKNPGCSGVCKAFKAG